MPTSEAPQRAAVASYGLLLLTFIAAIFVSAALLFAVQPMFTKMVLPRLGGAASVWSVAIVFFQTTLLAGYAYAHLLTRFQPGRSSVIIHLVVLASACFLLPLHIASGWGRPPQVGEAFWLLGLFTVSIGLPFFALSANGPLLQAWFVRTGHPDAKDPYFLYAASNVGSFLALIAYPVAVEPFVRLGDQTWLWTAGYYLLIAMVAGCSLLMLRSPNRLPDAVASDTTPAVTPSWRDAAIWVALAAVPSGLLIAVTAHISTDVAAVPLFWTIPLAIYLLTFVIVFQTKPFIPHWLVVAVQPAFVLFLVIAILMIPIESIVLQIVIHLSVFFVCALMCHGELARRRPPPQFLTSYYMWISFGGMVGGILTGLVAPQVSSRIIEYPLLVVLTLLCRPGFTLPTRGSGQYPLLLAVAVAALLLIGMAAVDIRLDTPLYAVAVGFLLGLTVQFWKTPLPFAAIVAMLFLVNHYNNYITSNYLVRNFFGVLNVVEASDDRFRVLYHGTTAQGAQRIRDYDGNLLTGRPDMVSEFHDGGGFAQVVDAMEKKAGGPINMAVIGLGTGALACRGSAGTTVTFYEIDADIARIARDPSLFNYISECAPKTQIVIGDARLTLADAPDGSYDLLFVDAFIGAAIPVHLLTREALELYFRKLKPGGIVAMHVSNRNLELATVVAGIAQANGAIVRVYDGGDIDEDVDEHRWIPTIAAVARNEADFGSLAKSEFWPIRERDPHQRVWTDDYSNIVGALLRHLRSRQVSSDE
ncbi:MAG: class I SAM-dependent methyltransferase [Rhizobiales bacterium]|nr:class I SAM-dependent methyltransferase [Hyphomicrobiales bacterium]